MRITVPFTALAFMCAPTLRTAGAQQGCSDIRKQLTAAQAELKQWKKWRDDNWIDIPGHRNGGMTKAEAEVSAQLESTQAELSKLKAQQDPSPVESTLQIGTVTLRPG